MLFGAEISFARQNVAAFEFEADCSRLSHSFKRIVALVTTHHCVREFIQEKKAPTAEEIAVSLEIPIRLVRSTLFELTEAKVLSEVGTSGQVDVAYQPGCRTDDLTVTKVLNRLDQQGTDVLPMAESDKLERLREVLRGFDEMNEKSPGNLRLQEL